MASFISVLLTIVAGLAIVGGILGAALQKFNDESMAPPLAVMALGLVLLGLCSVTIVGTRNTAVQISMGKPLGTLDNGLHFVRPWSTTESYDGSLQTQELRGDKEEGDGPGVAVRLANGAVGRVDLNVQWEINPKADITQLHLDYKSFDNIQPKVVEIRTRSAVTAVFGTYDPVASLKGEKTTVDLSELASRVKEELVKQLPSELLVRSVTLLPPSFDKVTEESLQKLAQAKTETQIAQQRLLTAEAQKAANDKLAQANNSPGVLFQNCLDMTERQAQLGHSISAAWTCGAPGNPLGLAITSVK